MEESGHIIGQSCPFLPPARRRAKKQAPKQGKLCFGAHWLSSASRWAAPAVIGRNGVEKVIEINLNETEKAAFAKSAEAVRNTNKILHEIGAL